MQALEGFEIKQDEKILIYGIGNVGRQDDGIAIRLVEQLEASLVGTPFFAQITFESNYQLGIEDALLLSDFDVVFFVDATKESQALSPFSIRRLLPSHELAFTTHAMSFSTILSICDELYGRTPKTFLITVPGYEWGISETMSDAAKLNLKQTVNGITAGMEGAYA